MKKKTLSSYYITIMVFCQFLLCCVTGIASAVEVDSNTEVHADTYTDAKGINIISSCSEITKKLKTLQREDSYTRTYLGDRYDTIATNYIKPLNTRLVLNNYATTDAENQSNLTLTKTLFAADFVTYQKSLEDLISTDCKADPEIFYNKLNVVREKRKVMSQDILTLEEIISKHVLFVNQLEIKSL